MNTRLSEIESNLRADTSILIGTIILYFLIYTNMVYSVNIGSIEINNYDFLILSAPVVLILMSYRIIPHLFYRRHIRNIILLGLYEETEENKTSTYHEFCTYSFLSYNDFLKDEFCNNIQEVKLEEI